MNILITGATGFIGSNLVEKLQTLDHKLYLLKRSSSNTSRLSNLQKNVSFLSIDSYDDLPKIFDNYHFDAIMHLATYYVKNEKSLEEIETMNTANVTLPSLLLNLAVKNGVSAFINTGTCFEYKPTKKNLTETDLLEPYNYYAATKTAFEQILKYYAKDNLRALTLKLFFPYGEKDNEKLIPLLVKSFINKQSFHLTKGEQRLGFTYVKDIVDAYISALAFITSGNYKKYEIFNIGSANTHSPREIVEELEKISKKKIDILFDAPYSKNEIMYMACDPEKAKKILGWQPQTDLLKGLKKVYAFYKG